MTTDQGPNDLQEMYDFAVQNGFFSTAKSVRILLNLEEVDIDEGDSPHLEHGSTFKHRISLDQSMK